MKKFIYTFLAGLTIAGLASCEKQELKPVSEKDIYSIVIEEEIQTKASDPVVIGETKTFHAYLKKNGTPVDCSSWDWDPGNHFSSIKKGYDSYTPNGYSTSVIAGFIEAKAISVGNAQIQASTKPVGSSSSITGGTSSSVKGVSKMTFNVDKTSLVAGGSTSYTVKVRYTGEYSDKDVTSKATVTSSNSTMLSVYSGNSDSKIISNKKIGCLGTFTVTASYGGESASKNITVNTDYKSDDIKLSWTSDVGRSGEASSGTLSGYVKRNDASQVAVSFSGTEGLKTSNSDTYAVSDSFIELYVKDKGNPDSSYSKASTSQTYWAEEGDGEVYELRYLGKAVKTWTINWNAY